MITSPSFGSGRVSSPGARQEIFWGSNPVLTSSWICKEDITDLAQFARISRLGTDGVGAGAGFAVFFFPRPLPAPLLDAILFSRIRRKGTPVTVVEFRRRWCWKLEVRGRAALK